MKGPFDRRSPFRKASSGGGGGTPAISGFAMVGQTLTASGGTSYQWVRGTFDIPGATGSTYVLTELDSYMRVRVRDVPSSTLSAQTAIVAEAATLWSMFDPCTSLTGRTITTGPGVTQALATSPIGVGGAIDYTLNGMPATPAPANRLSSANFTITDPILDSNIIVTVYDQGTAGMSNGNGGGKLNLTSNVNYFAPTGASSAASNPTTNAGVNAGGLQWSAQSAFLMRISSFAGARWSQQTFPQAATLQQNPAGFGFNGQGTLKIGPVLRVTRAQKPTVTICLDDANSAQFTSLYPLLESRNMKATVFAPRVLIGQVSKFTFDNARTLKESGWAFCINSGPGDEPLTSFATPAAACADMDAQGAALVAEGLGVISDFKHVSISYGSSAYPSTHVVRTCSSDGVTASINDPGSFYQNFIGVGMAIKGTGLGTAPTITGFTDSDNATTSAVIPLGTRALTFCAVSAGLTVTCNATTTITPVNTTGLVVGMQMQGRDVPANTTISTIDVEGVSGTITVNNAVPATCVQATFFIPGAPWLPGAWAPAAITAGYKSAIGTSAVQGTFTGFGLPPTTAMRLERMSIESGGNTAIHANIEAAIHNRQDIHCFTHWTNAGALDGPTLANWTATLDFLAAKRDAGEIDIVTYPEWYARSSARNAAPLYAARFGTLNTIESGAFNTALYPGPTPANGTYGEFTVASGVITPNTTPLTAGTYSVGGWTVTVSAQEFAVATQAEFNAISAAQNGMRVVIREGALLTIPRSWRQNQNVAGMILEGDCVQAPHLTIQDATLDARAHIVQAAFGGQDNLTLNRLRIVTGSAAGAWVNGITLQDQPEDMQITNCAIICSRPDPYGAYSGGNATFPGGKGIVFASPGVWRCSIRDVAVVGAREFAIEAGAVNEWVEIIGVWADLTYGDGVRVPTSLNRNYTLGGYLYTRPMALDSDAGNPHADAVQSVGDSYGIVEAVAITDAGTRATGGAQGIFLANGISRDTIRDCLTIDKSLWPFSAYLPEDALVERLAWVPAADHAFPVTGTRGGMRFGSTGVTGGTNVMRDSSLRGFGGVHVSITQTGNFDTSSYLAADWTAAFPEWASLPATEVPSPATLSRLFMRVGRASPLGATFGKAPLVNYDVNAPWSAYDLPNVAAPALTSLNITPTVGGGNGTVQTTVPLDPISWAVCPTGTPVPTAAAVKRRKVSGATAYGMRTVSRPQVGTSLAFTLSGLASGVPVIVFVAQFNGASKSSVVSFTFTPT